MSMPWICRRRWEHLLLPLLRTRRESTRYISLCRTYSRDRRGVARYSGIFERRPRTHESADSHPHGETHGTSSSGATIFPPDFSHMRKVLLLSPVPFFSFSFSIVPRDTIARDEQIRRGTTERNSSRGRIERFRRKSRQIAMSLREHPRVFPT